MPVEEILRRMQAVEAAQNRHVTHWQAVNATTLRFQAASGVQAVEATFEGSVFFERDKPFDWAWERFFLNGVRWKGKSIPEIPLVQPERVAAMPLEILFTKEYRYSLRGAERIGDRDCWAVEFEPAAPVEGRTLSRGTVWVDRETYARVRTRAVQLGLEGDILSNEETIDYQPVDAAGAPVAWSADAFVLPLHTVAQQVLSVLNTGLVVEKEVTLTGVEVNSEAFEKQRADLFSSATTMVRDTDAGLRYLVPKRAGRRRARGEGGLRREQALPARRRVLRRVARLPAAARRTELLQPRLPRRQEAAELLLRRCSRHPELRRSEPVRHAHRPRRRRPSASRSPRPTSSTATASRARARRSRSFPRARRSTSASRSAASSRSTAPTSSPTRNSATPTTPHSTSCCRPTISPTRRNSACSSRAAAID
jgi:hypothetical protein